MIGALRYFAARYLAPRYWPKAGAAADLFGPIRDTSLAGVAVTRRLLGRTAPGTLAGAVRRTLTHPED